MRSSDWSSDVCSSDLGDVDLGHVVADHVDADEDQALLREDRADRLADLLLAAGQRGLLADRADMEVGARLAGLRHAADAAGRLAVDQDDPPVAVAYLRQVALHDDRLAVEAGEHFADRKSVV